VSSLEIVLPRRLRERLEEEAEGVGLSAEEFVLKVVAERLNSEVDPPEVAEVYVKLAESTSVRRRTSSPAGTSFKPPKSCGAPPPSWSRPLPLREGSS
jgi:hypothetical protein